MFQKDFNKEALKSEEAQSNINRERVIYKMDNTKYTKEGTYDVNFY